MGIINYIEFGGVKSSDYGIYVSGEGTFNAPERDVELIEIPGRNGDFSLDKGRFKNITVTYPVFNYETNLTDFRTRLSDFRNALKSKIGYQRLEDTFHPDEYRMATFIDVFEVQPVMYNTASTIELTFNCKPQRFLKSGEIPQAIGEWGETETVSGSIATFEAESNTGIKSLVANIEPIQSGTGDPSPSNVRPISGWSGVNVGVSGVNVWDEEWIRGIMYSNGSVYADGNGIISKNFCPCRPNTQYYSNQFVCWYDINKTFISRVGAGAKTSPSNAYYFKITTADGYGTTYKNDIVVNYPSTDTSYHPYQGETITKSLGRTVYGGTLDLTSGVLTAFPYYSSYNGQTLNGEWICDRAVYSQGTTPPTGSQVVDMSGTGTELTLTPTEINTLLGVNNIWADSGEVSVEFGADPNDAYNPTPFSSRPLIETEGHGLISINGQNVNILPAKPLGYIPLWVGTRPPENIGESIYLDFSKFNTGDKFYLSAIYSVNYYALEYLKTTQGTGTSSNADFIVNNATISFEDDILRFDALTPEDIEFTIGTEKTVTTTFTINTTNPTLTISIPFSIHYIPSQNVITLGADTEEATSGVSGSVEGYSSVVIETTTYIDCEIGEAYYLEDGEVISANNSVSLPAILPELKAGNNPITHDDTITDLKITPRWWKI